MVKKAKKAAAKPLRCAAKTAAGTRCKKTASGKSKFCASHKTAASRKGPVKKKPAKKKTAKKCCW